MTVNNIILDTCFWRAIYDPKDDYYDSAQHISDIYVDKPAYKILVPYPTMYELLRTEFVKNKANINALDNFLKKECIEKVCDEPYRDRAIELSLNNNKRNLSIVDNLLRLMLEDTDLQIDGIVTFNVGDFIDVCKKRDIILINNRNY